MDEETEIQVRFTQLVNNIFQTYILAILNLVLLLRLFFFFAPPVPKARFLKGSVIYLTWEKGKKIERKVGREE